MITLITGTPGSGKTAYALDLMLKLQKENDKSDSPRPLFVHGIPNLKLDHYVVVCDSATCDHCTTLDKSQYHKAENWHEWAPDGAIFFFDEVQNIHRPRHASAKVPDCIAAYEVHRHRGLDFFMITQNPMLIDSNIRALISRHIHLTATWARRVQHEWSQCKSDLSSTVGDAIQSTYKIPKHVFELYKSASLHTKIERKKPFVLFLLPVLVLATVYFIYSVYKRHDETSQKIETPAETTKQEKSTPVNHPTRNLASAGAGEMAQARTPAPALASNLVKLDFVSLFKKWGVLGVPDSDLAMLPTNCLTTSHQVRCQLSTTSRYVKYVPNRACTETFCIALLSRQVEKELPRNKLDKIIPNNLASNF